MKEVMLGLGGGGLIQVAHRTPTQMMSYIIECPQGQTVMIDGGNYLPEDGENLHGMLVERGGRVSEWFITHAHIDHLGSLLYILENYDDIRIDRITMAFPTERWLSVYEKKDYPYAVALLKVIARLGIPVYTPTEGERMAIGGIEIDVLSVPREDEYLGYTSTNATSLILKVHFPKRSVLFLSDYNAESEKDYLKSRSIDALRCDICQMAHHGQNGVSEEFYRLIRPKVCLYTAPKWLWENNLYRCDDPETAGKGPFTTLQTRQWMDALGVEESYAQTEGDIRFI